MKEREKILLDYLRKNEEWHTATFLSTRFNVSVRTIKSYISSINDQAPMTIISGRNGYKINNKEKAKELLGEEVEDIPQTSENRNKFILRKLLIEKQEMDLDELANQLCISMPTLNNELRAIKPILSQYDLVFKTKRNQISIDGSEKNKKKLIAKTIYEESIDGFLSLEIIQSYFPKYNLNLVKKMITKELLQNKCFMDDFSLVNFILHVAITMQRSEVFQIHENISSKQDVIIYSHVKDIIHNICDQLTSMYGIQFSEMDIYSLSVLMMTRILKNNANNISVEDLSTIVGNDVYDLFLTIKDSVRDVFNISLDSKDFIIRFCIHLKNMLIRLENDMCIRNPQMLQIKNNYPFIYDVSVYISKVIFDHTGLQLSEDEIAYIALHIGVLIEERNAIRSKISVLFLCPQYFYKKSNIVDKCMPIFENDILNAGVVTTYDELLQYENYDAIVSTVPFRTHMDIPIIMVSTYFTTKDILAVSQMVEQAHHNKVMKKLERKLTQLFKKEAFYINEPFKNEKEAIIKMSSDLEKLGYVNEDFTEKLFEREHIASSAFGNIAMPHPLNMCSNSSIISVSIHHTPIPWNLSKVNIVFMLAISDDFRPLFADIFDFITEIISNDSLLFQLINVKSYEEFIQYILSLCS